MGLQQSKDESLYKRVNSGNVEGIKALRRQGAGLEWTDSEGKTPLIVACMRLELYNVAKTLIELGANPNAYRRGRNGGGPLHHAAKSGLEETVKLLLSHGANALAMNDDYQTPLDIARDKGYGNIVRAIEAHVCLFSGWLRELHGPGFLDHLAPQLLSRRVWVVVLPCGSHNKKRKALRLELAIYSNVQDAQPRTIVPLWKAKLEEPNFNQPEPVATLSRISRIPKRWRKRRAIKSSQDAARTRIKLVPGHESEKHQLQRFCNACKGIPQVTLPLFPVPTVPVGVETQVTPPLFPVPTAPVAVEKQVAPPLFPIPTAPVTIAESTSEDEQLAMAIKASLQSASHVQPPHTYSHAESSFNIPTSPTSSNKQSSTGWPGSIHTSNGSKCKDKEASSLSIPAKPVKSSSIIQPIMQENPSPISPPSSNNISGSAQKGEEDGTTSSCTICLDAPVEGACIPCGHMVGCMSCLNEIKAKKFGCPLCRSDIDQIIRIYAA